MPNDSLHTTQLHGWLERMRGGDDSARDELLRSVCGRLEHLARKMLRDFPGVKRWEQTDDVLQNALLRLMRALEKVDPYSVRDFFALAAVQIRRELLDLAKHYYGAQGQGANYQSVSAAPAAPSNEADDLDKWTAFHREVEKLPAEEREVVNLVFYHGWSQAEVAELFQVSVRTVKRYWQQARWKLHQSLNEEMS